jgi:hypothetical protein
VTWHQHGGTDVYDECCQTPKQEVTKMGCDTQFDELYDRQGPTDRLVPRGLPISTQVAPQAQAEAISKEDTLDRIRDALSRKTFSSVLLSDCAVEIAVLRERLKQLEGKNVST